MLGADRREVAPDLAPSGAAIGVGNPDEDRRSIAHDAERGLHRNLDGCPKDEGFKPVDRDTHEFRLSLLTPA